MSNIHKGQGDLFPQGSIPIRRRLVYQFFRTEPANEIMHIRPWDGKALHETIINIGWEYKHDECFPYREAIIATVRRTHELSDPDFRFGLNVQDYFEKVAAIDVCARIAERSDALAYIKLQAMMANGPQANASKALVYAFFHSAAGLAAINSAAQEIKEKTVNAPRTRYNLLFEETKKMFAAFINQSAETQKLFELVMGIASRDFSHYFNRLVEYNKRWLYDTQKDSEHVRKLED